MPPVVGNALSGAEEACGAAKMPAWGVEVFDSTLVKFDATKAAGLGRAGKGLPQGESSLPRTALPGGHMPA